MPGDWQVVAGNGPAAGRARWVEFGQSWFPGAYHTFALRAADGGCAVAMGGAVLTEPAAIARRDPYQILAGTATGSGLVLEEPPWQAVPPTAVFPCLMLMYPNYSAYPVGGGASDGVMLRRFVTEATGWARDQGIRSIALLYLTPDTGPLMAELERCGFSRRKIIDRCELAVTWSDPEGYLGTLPRRYRFKARKEQRRIAERGLHTGTRPLATDEPELVDLRCRLIAKYDGVANRAAEQAIFDRIREHVDPDDITVFTLSAAGRLLSFSLFIQDGEEWTAMFTGSDYAAPDVSLAYFSTVFYQPVAEAPRLGVRTINYGPGSVGTKQRRGCVTKPLYAAELRLGPRVRPRLSA